LMDRFVEAFARHDFDTLVAVLREDVTRPTSPSESLEAIAAA
jgi:hypothetical protein